MKKNLFKMVFLCLLLGTITNVSYSDVLTGHMHWWSAGSIGRGWNINDSYKVVSNAVLKNEGNTSHLTLYLSAAKYDFKQPMRLELRTKAPGVKIKIYGAKDTIIPFKVEKGGATVEVSAGELEFHKFEGEGVQIDANTSPARIELETPADAPLLEADLYYALAGSSDHVDIAPLIAAPKIQPVSITPEVRQTADGFILKSTFVSAEFSTAQGLQLKSLRDEYAGKNILIDPAQTHLFLTEIKGKRFGAEEWQVQKVLLPAKDAVQVNLVLSQYHLTAQFKISLADNGLKLGLQLQNEGSAEQSWKTVFPQIGGLSISDQPDDDYYLYPMYGGLVQKINANLRLYYGAGNEALWQMIDLFSPALGTGMSLRSLDKDGTLKGMAFRKGATNPAYGTMISTYLKQRTSPDYLWNTSLPGGNGSSLGFEFSTYTRAAGKNVIYPDAMIEMHPGDWHNAMRTYADWAHKAWQWRPLHI